MKKASIIGYGGLGQQFHEFLKDIYKTDFFFFDDRIQNSSSNLNKPFVEYIEEKYKDSDFYVVLVYKNLQLKNKILNELKTQKSNIPKFIHNTSFVNKTALIDDSVFIYPMCNIDIHVNIKQGSVINNGVIISHDSTIGNSCYISPGCIISGNVTIGDCTFIGSGTVISDNINIGSNVKIGIGTVVTSDIPDNVSVIGNPMRILNTSLSL